MLLIVIDVGLAVLTEPAHPVTHFQSGQLIRAQVAVTGGSPEGVSVQLPLAQGIVILVFLYSLIGVSL